MTNDTLLTNLILLLACVFLIMLFRSILREVKSFGYQYGLLYGVSMSILIFFWIILPWGMLTNRIRLGIFIPLLYSLGIALGAFLMMETDKIKLSLLSPDKTLEISQAQRNSKTAYRLGIFGLSLGLLFLAIVIWIGANYGWEKLFILD